MNLTRRHMCASLAAAGVFLTLPPAGAEQPIKLTDMAGREVTLPALPKRIILLEAHDLFTMSLLHPDPASLVAGWAAVDRMDSDFLVKHLSNGHDIPVVGKQSPDTVSVEALISLAPDLVVTTAFMTPPEMEDGLLAGLKKLGVPVVFSDISSNSGNGASNPLNDLKTSMTMWGRILGASDKATAFTAFFEQELAAIAKRLAGAAPVTTYLEVQSTPDDCCWAAGRKIWGTLLEMAGGQVLPEVKSPWFEKLSTEYLLSTPQDVYIATGGGWAASGRPEIAPGLDEAKARQSLQKLVDARPLFASLPSVKNNRVYGIWSGLITNLPLNLLFVAQTAKWLHPERCADLQPQALLDRINADFATIQIKGPLWVSL
ncbi:ABC transporter substrate-binding protein [Rhizobium paknamense]|uniref:Iron complex transport system substrate-binding protein n=1 Tax=Rhizobium paknamense TaxID=1206817 RepID=A0ABU0IKK2_9HYPH|nr:ABC transporter substrate-binding protein [Rhizobium paknamense]MDQ0457776.1 iron complex transport system substrate-binding protein [Rhizobium paknamense]